MGSPYTFMNHDFYCLGLSHCQASVVGLYYESVGSRGLELRQTSCYFEQQIYRRLVLDQDRSSSMFARPKAKLDVSR